MCSPAATQMKSRTWLVTARDAFFSTTITYLQSPFRCGRGPTAALPRVRLRSVAYQYDADFSFPARSRLAERGREKFERSPESREAHPRLDELQWSPTILSEYFRVGSSVPSEL